MKQGKLLATTILMFFVFFFGFNVLAEDLKIEASMIVKSGTNLNAFLKYNKVKKDTKAQIDAMKKYTEPLVKGLKGIKTSHKYAINNFIVYGTPSVQKMTIEKRYQLVFLYKESSKKVPLNQADWIKVLGMYGVQKDGFLKILDVYKPNSNCKDFVNKLSSCAKYKCFFLHPMVGGPMNREISGIVDGKCVYTEEMPNNGKMVCKYDENTRKNVVSFYKNMFSAMSSGAKISMEGGTDGSTYTINGKESVNPLQEAMDNGQCVIFGYGYDENNQCPAGTIYKGSIGSNLMCSDPNKICPTCENCASGLQIKAFVITADSANEVCRECSFNSDCKSGYICKGDKCIAE